MENPQEFVDILERDYKFSLKGMGPISFHLGMEFQRDADGTLAIMPQRYIEKIVANYERLFGELPKQNVSSPVAHADHPELDDSELLSADDVVKYQSLIGSLQWVVTIGRFDVCMAIMTLSSFRAAPRKGHMDRVKRIFRYLAKMKHAAICIRVDELDYSNLPIL